MSTNPSPAHDTPRKVIIDTDCGVDDAFALMLALRSPGVQVVAVTCVNGNATLDNVIVNVAKVLHACGSDIPFYAGARHPLIGRPELDKWPGHGLDGLGATEDHKTEAPTDLRAPEDKAAANAIVDIVNASPGEVSIMLLGPMTNLALALQLSATVSGNLQEVVFMGGTVGGKGNASLTAEFNFLADPEAAHIVLDEIQTTAVMCSWELTVDHGLSWDWYDQHIGRSDSKLARFARAITRAYVRTVRDDKESMELGKFVVCDVLAAAVFADPSIITKSVVRHGTVELAGRFSRGHLAIDWYTRGHGRQGREGNNLLIVEEIRHDMLESMLAASLDD